MNTTFRDSGRPWLDTTLFRERLREERPRLRLPAPSPPDPKPATHEKPNGTSCIIIQVWPTDPEPSGEDTDSPSRPPPP